MNSLVRAIGIGAALALAGCASTPGIEVTRFHLGQPIPSDRVAVIPAAGIDGSSLEFRTYAAAVAQELARVGFPTGTPAAYTAVLGVTQNSFEGPPRSSGLSIGLGGFTGGNVGLGGSVAVPVGGRRANTQIGTQLTLKLLRASDNSVVWEGRASRALPAGDPASGGGAAVPALARALLNGFPGKSGQTITVKP